MIRKLATLVAQGTILAGLAAINPAGAAPLPAANCPVNCLTFGDFTVYSLALINMQATGSTANPNPGDPFYVKSTPGELGTDPYIVYGTGTSNNGAVTNVPNADNAFDTSASGSPNSKFRTTTAAEPAPVVPGETTGTWDATTAALRGTLGTGPFVIYFNLNETGNDDLNGIDLLIWVKVQVCKDAAATICDDFYVKGGPLEPPFNSPLVDNLVPTDPTDAQVAANDQGDPRWTLVHGSICAGPGGTFLHFGPCVAADGASAKTLNQNLGANQAAFAIFNQQVSDAVTDPSKGYNFFHLTWLMAAEVNGFEQAFSTALTPGTSLTPAPGSVLLSGIALLALAGIARRGRKGTPAA